MRLEDVRAVVDGVPFMTPRQGRTIYEFLLEHRLSQVLELGFAHGVSSCYLGAAVDELGDDGHVLTMDMVPNTREPDIRELLARCGLEHRVTPVWADKSFTWELMKLLERPEPPRFDLVYIDGGHTWDTTGFAVLLAERMLRPGGWLLLDDLDWTIATSPASRDRPWALRLPEEQRRTPQVRKVFELLVARDPGWEDVREDGSWGWARKRADTGGRTREDRGARIGRADPTPRPGRRRGFLRRTG